MPAEVGLTEEAIPCPHCHVAMQVSTRRYNKKKELIQLTYICGCRGSVYFHNVHHVTEQK